MFSSFFSFFYSLNVRSTHWERRCVDVGVDVDISGAPSFKYKSKRRSGRLPVGASWLSWNVHAGQKALAPRRSARISFACVCVCVCVKSARVFRTRVGSVRPHSRCFVQRVAGKRNAIIVKLQHQSNRRSDYSLFSRTARISSWESNFEIKNRIMLLHT